MDHLLLHPNPRDGRSHGICNKKVHLMPFEKIRPTSKRIAVIGGGISGMGAAHLLAHDHTVVLFENEQRLGGHARTVIAGRNGNQPVDTGFIVFNYANYPRLTRLFKRLNVPVTKSEMSFAASINGGDIEYSLGSLGSLFAQPKNAVHPKFLRMVRDILRFNAKAVQCVGDERQTIKELLNELGMGSWFRRYYLAPFSGAIWSTPIDKVMDFPARALVQFFDNHALLNITGQHQWYTVCGGSIEYVTRLQKALEDQAVDIRLGQPIAMVRRQQNAVSIKPSNGQWQEFDEVVFATHSDDTLRMLSDATDLENRHLGAITYQANEAILHCDDAVMPTRRKCWSSWNYTEEAGRKAGGIDLSYWMNKLQPIPGNDPMFVTLNSQRPIDPAKIYDTKTFRHPVYNVDAFQAQRVLAQINGTNNTWFCGAWMKNGFHEDGYASACDVAAAMGALPEWA